MDRRHVCMSQLICCCYYYYCYYYYNFVFLYVSEMKYIYMVGIYKGFFSRLVQLVKFKASSGLCYGWVCG